MGNIELHRKIDDFLKLDPSEAKVEVINGLIDGSEDRKLYFYLTAGEKWIEWLNKNSFFNFSEITREANLQNRIPELLYLERIADEKKKAGVLADIITSTEVSEETHPEVIDRLLSITSELPASELVKIVPKIYEEKWILLLNRYNHYGFHFEKMFKTLQSEEQYETALLLADAVLLVKNPVAKEKSEEDYWASNPFYFGDIESTGVFDLIEQVTDSYVEMALALVARVMSGVVTYNKSSRDPGEPFKIGDGFSFYDVDFFTLEVGQKKHSSYRDDLRDLAATMKSLIERAFHSGSSEDAVKGIFSKNILTLPDSQAMWRLRLFVLSLRRDIFKGEIKEYLFRITKEERPHNLTMGPEYEQLLKCSLDLFSDEEKQAFKDFILDSFSVKDAEKLTKGDIFGISSIIADWFTRKERIVIEEYLGGNKLIPDYQPEPAISSSKSFWMKSLSLVSSEELSQMDIETIIDKLQSVWAPSNLKEVKEDKDGNETSYDAEGLASVIKEDIAKRFQDYISKATLFFDRERINPHYTYTFLGGVFDVIQKNRVVSESIDWSGLFDLFLKIQGSFQKNSEDINEENKEKSRIWLSGWAGVHRSISEILKGLITAREDKKSIIVFEDYREKILSVTEYLLTHTNPNPTSEACKPQQNRRDGEVEYDCSDPYTHAINSVRGKAFELLINFIHRDSPGSSTIVDPRVKAIYADLLERESTKAIRFLFGHYFPTIHFKDKVWASGIAEKLFNFDEPTDYDLSLASWEGYLTNNIYVEAFKDLEIYYSKAIELQRASYTPRKYFKDLDEVLAIHIALAYIHFQDFNTDSLLFKKFWEVKNLKRQKEFVSFAGRYVISRDNAKAWLRSNKIENLKKVESLWNWLLEQELDIDVYKSFGFWMDAEWEVFDLGWQAQKVRKTLEKTNGAIEWDHNLQKSLTVYLAADPRETFKIVSLHFIYLAECADNQGWIHIDEEVLKIFKDLYNNPDLKNETYALIDKLLPYGRGKFWELKKVIEE